MQLVVPCCVEASLLTLNLDDALQGLDCVFAGLLVQHRRRQRLHLRGNKWSGT